MENNYRNFVERVRLGLSEFYGDDKKIMVQSVSKNNGVLLQGITVMELEHTMGPTIYMEEFYNLYKKNGNFGETMLAIIEAFDSGKMPEAFALDFFNDYEKVKEKLVYRLIDFEKNQTLLEDVPYIPFLDLALVCQCLIVTEIFGNGVVMIADSHLKSWNISKEQLFADTKISCQKIQPYEFKTMNYIIKELFESEMEPGEDMKEYVEEMIAEIENQEQKMYILTNINRFYGASCICYDNIQEEIEEILGGDYYVIPSSVHELIIIKADHCIDVNELNKMVNEVNDTQVLPEEYLSNHVYFYDSNKKSLTCAK
ncbi:MAG: DUF5688 family protein [Lachnospiraceae bacterium]